MLHAAPPKSYELDLTSGWVYSDVTAPYIMDIVNASIASGSFSKNKKTGSPHTAFNDGFGSGPMQL